MNIPLVLQPMHWLSTQPAQVENWFGAVCAVVFLLMCVGAVVLRMKTRGKNRPWQVRRFMRMESRALSTMGLVGLVLLFMSYERIYPLGARFWYLFWVLGLAVWAYFLIRYQRVTLPKLLKSEADKVANDKYLPGHDR